MLAGNVAAAMAAVAIAALTLLLGLFLGVARPAFTATIIDVVASGTGYASRRIAALRAAATPATPREAATLA